MLWQTHALQLLGVMCVVMCDRFVAEIGKHAHHALVLGVAVWLHL
jgi:hypothetical protein